MRSIACLLLLAGTLAAQTITGIVNPASDLPPGVPNYGIAQGSVFIIYGANLAASGLVQASLPLPTTLGGVTISVAAGSSTPVQVPILYVSAGQLAAVMPSTTPVGSDTVTVSYNGRTVSAPVTVTGSTFGISTGPGGYGPAAVVFGGTPNLVNPNNSATAGDVLTIYGTGLGALAAGVSDAVGAPVYDLNAAGVVKIQVLVGGVPATVTFAGRSPGSVGLDQINFTVPATAPLGCQISVIVKTTSPTVTVSNAPTIAIAATDHAVCSDATQTIPQTVYNTALTKAGGVKAIGVSASLSTNYNSGTSSTSGSLTAFFLGFTPAQIASDGLNSTSSLNSCYTQVIPGSPSGGGAPASTGLDAGSSILVSDPSGKSKSVPSAGTGIYSASAGSFAAGAYTLTAPGGAGVDATALTFTLPQPVTWTNMSSISAVSTLNPIIDRTKDLTITWSGGDAFSYVEIVGSAQIGTSSNPAYTLGFDCAAPTAAGTFTIPSAILQMMPTGTTAYASIQVDTNALPTAVSQVAGFDLTVNTSKFQTQVPVIFK